MKFAFIAPLALLSFVSVAATIPAAAEAPDIYHSTLGEKGSTSELSTAEMKKLVHEGGAMIVDTRTHAEFDAGHLPGAAVLDGSGDQHVALVEKLAGGDKNKPMVLYCNGPYCQASRRLADRLVKAGFSHVRRYQLGIPVWRALGGPIAMEIGGMKRVVGLDKTAVFIDLRPAPEFAKASLPGALNAPAEDIAAGKLKKLPLPEDDFNRRVILIGNDAKQAREIADVLGKRPWHNVSYFNGGFAQLQAAGIVK